MPLPRIVAFTGPIGAGKTTAANCLRDTLQYEKVSFAKPLKDMLLAIGCTPADVYGEDKEKPSILLCGKTPRYAMQTLGTEWGRDLIGKELWVRVWQFECQKHRLVTVDDARFPNEFAMIKSLNGIIIKIVRPGFHLSMEHESESHEPLYNRIVNNDNDERNFRRRLIHTLRIYEGSLSGTLPE